MHVVRRARAIWDHVKELLVAPVGRVLGGMDRRAVQVVGGEIRQQRANRRERFQLGIVHEMRDPGGRGVHLRAAQPVEVDVLVRHRLHDVRTGNEHVGDGPHHEHEIGDGGAVHRSARARPEHRADLGHDTGGERVAQEDLGVPAQRRHALLDPRAARVVEADDRRAGLHREVHHLADFFRVRLGQGATEHGEVLREHEDRPAVDAAVPGYHSVAQILLVRQAKVARAVRHEAVQLHEGAAVEQCVDPFPRGQLALVVL